MRRLLIEKGGIDRLFNILPEVYSIIGPKISSGVIVLDKIIFSDIPAGYSDMQGRGFYRLNKTGDRLFSFGNGPDSPKRFLHRPHKVVHRFQKTAKGSSIMLHEDERPSYAFFGIRPCDLKSMEVLDKVFTHPEDEYRRLREDAVVIAVNCTRSGENCFCTSVGSGPEVRTGFDVAITELNNGLLLEAETDKGRRLLEGVEGREAGGREIEEKNTLIDLCRASIKKGIRTDDLPGFLYRNFSHKNWEDVAERCLACGNCTQVCPTCFCSSTYDFITLSGMRRPSEFSGERVRVWDSCFSKNFARVHGGNFRTSRRARYRHWLNHKLAYWIDEFGMSGCVGCGRCITWCPVGIDITEEFNRLRG